MISDEANPLDMQVVLADGRVAWASDEPELLWALRGGGRNFGGQSILPLYLPWSCGGGKMLIDGAVVTALKLRACPYPTHLFAALLFYPLHRALYALHSRPSDAPPAHRSKSGHAHRHQR